MLLWAGCASIDTHTSKAADSTGPYSGVRTDASMIAGPKENRLMLDFPVWMDALGVACAAIDLPLSAGIDTLLLPYDLATLRRSATEGGTVETDGDEAR